MRRRHCRIYKQLLLHVGFARCGDSFALTWKLYKLIQSKYQRRVGATVYPRRGEDGLVIMSSWLANDIAFELPVDFL